MVNSCDNDLTVAVWMVTYNHEKFIAQAIESVINQRTTFKLKLFIGDDCSTDNTRNVCLAFQQKYPDIIDLVIQEVNIGANLNARIIYKKCIDSGAKFIAMLEGDDYWTDSLKLQKQVDFLDANDDYSICFHNVNFISADDKIIDGYEDKDKEIFLVEDTYPGTFMATASMVWRASIGFPVELFNKIPYGDWVIQMYSLYKGKGYCLKERMANYRFHSGGVHSTLSALVKLKNRTICYREFTRYFKMTKEQCQVFNRFYYQTAWNYFFSAINQRKISHVFLAIKYLLTIKNENNFWKIILHLFRIKKIIHN